MHLSDNGLALRAFHKQPGPFQKALSWLGIDPEKEALPWYRYDDRNSWRGSTDHGAGTSTAPKKSTSNDFDIDFEDSQIEFSDVDEPTLANKDGGLAAKLQKYFDKDAAS